MPSVYVNTQTDYSSPMSAEHQYPSFPGSEEVIDLNTYAKTMHQHTKRQMEAASRSARRNRQPAEVPSMYGGGDSTSSNESRRSS